MTGCVDAQKDWAEDFFQDMRSAEAEKGIDKNKEIADKYFPPDMKIEDANKKLRHLASHGFDVKEYRHSWARVWPAGPKVQYKDDETGRNLKNTIPENTALIVAEKAFFSPPSPVRKKISVKITQNIAANSTATEVKIWSDFI